MDRFRVVRGVRVGGVLRWGTLRNGWKFTGTLPVDWLAEFSVKERTVNLLSSMTQPTGDEVSALSNLVRLTHQKFDRIRARYGGAELESYWVLGDRVDLYPSTFGLFTEADDCAVFQTVVRPGVEGPPPHAHLRSIELTRVLAGSIQFRVGDGWARLEAGDEIAVPAGQTHTYCNDGKGPAVLLAAVAPGGSALTYFFRTVGRLRTPGDGSLPPVKDVDRRRAAKLYATCGMALRE